MYTQGRGQWGELGRGEVEERPRYNSSDPLDVQLPGEVVDLAAGVWHYVAVFSDGSVYGWGKARLGQLGDQLSNKVSVPTKIEGLSIKPIGVVCGKDFTYLISDPSSGEHTVLGKDKFNIISAMPPDVKGWKDVGATWHAIFILFADGRLAAWGKENQWKLLPPDLPKIDKIAVGTDHVLALTEGGKLISWGWGKHGNCGDLSNLRQEIKNDMISGFWNEIEIPGRIIRIAAGYCTSFVITEVGGDKLE
ncbi:alpha tubulin suppressor [Ascochyta clinopodiicola]|nr:alpha tubulin suppressor [Ascochyta clinopodiicola]